jgi:hypothetical protein
VPQFDRISFFNQLFWVLIFFSSTYFCCLNFLLPKTAAVLKARSKKIDKGTSNTFTFVTEFSQSRTTFDLSSRLLLAFFSKKISTVFEKIDFSLLSTSETFNKKVSLSPISVESDNRTQNFTSNLVFVVGKISSNWFKS